MSMAYFAPNESSPEATKKKEMERSKGWPTAHCTGNIFHVNYCCAYKIALQERLLFSPGDLRKLHVSKCALEAMQEEAESRDAAKDDLPAAAPAHAWAVAIHPTGKSVLGYTSLAAHHALPFLGLGVTLRLSIEGDN
jgi:hypothetical protein